MEATPAKALSLVPKVGFNRTFGIVLFVSIFLFSFLLQAYAWLNVFEALDGPLWATASKNMLKGELIAEDHPLYGYPGTTITSVTALFIWSGFEAREALRLALALLISIAIASIGLLTYVLRPNQFWWLGASGILIFSMVYTNSTPPSAFVSPLFVLLSLLVLAVEERRETIQLWPSICFGICGGIALATRIDISAVIVGAGLLFLCYHLRKKIWIPIAITGITFFLLDPYMWFTPFHHLFLIYEKIAHHFSEIHNAPLLYYLFKVTPLGITSFFLASVAFFLEKTLLPFSKNFLAWLLCISICLAAFLFSSAHHPPWMFYPLFLLWETLLPIFLITLVNTRKEGGGNPEHSFEFGLMCLIVVSQALLWSYSIAWVYWF